MSLNSNLHGKDTIHDNQTSYSNEGLQTTSKPLNFMEAMDDFSFMFPEIDWHAIETVLRANNGVVQSTIDQLLVLQESFSSSYKKSMEGNISASAEISTYKCMIGNGEDPPPAYSEVWDDNSSKAIGDVCDDSLVNWEKNHKNEVLLFANSRWKAPMVGELPGDFLRIESHHGYINEPLNENYPKKTSISFASHKNKNRDLREDERLAAMIQNAEFLLELRQNDEFLSSLEADQRNGVSTSCDAIERVYDQVPNYLSSGLNSSGGARHRTRPLQAFHQQDDAAFRQKLKHMGKSTKKKFRKMAKKFSHKHLGSRGQTLLTSDSKFNLIETFDDPDLVQDNIEEETLTEKGSEKNSQNNVTMSSRVLPVMPTPTACQFQTIFDGSYINHGESCTEIDGNVEPIVFYSEDNEFQYKKEI